MFVCKSWLLPRMFDTSQIKCKLRKCPKISFSHTFSLLLIGLYFVPSSLRFRYSCKYPLLRLYRRKFTKSDEQWIVDDPTRFLTMVDRESKREASAGTHCLSGKYNPSPCFLFQFSIDRNLVNIHVQKVVINGIREESTLTPGIASATTLSSPDYHAYPCYSRLRSFLILPPWLFSW